MFSAHEYSGGIGKTAVLAMPVIDALCVVAMQWRKI